MLFECTNTALNLRGSGSIKGTIIGELRLGDLFELDVKKSAASWVEGTVKTGISTGKKGFVRRKWLIQHFTDKPTISSLDRIKAAEIIAKRTTEFDAVTYKLGDKAKTWKDLKATPHIDCSGWVYLLTNEILKEYGDTTNNKLLNTFSDEQITNVGVKTERIISGHFISKDNLKAGMLMGIDFAEYSWDRDRPLDIDHIVAIGEDAQGVFISQSSSSGGGVNRVSLDKWLTSNQHLVNQGHVHLVDLLMLVK